MLESRSGWIGGMIGRPLCRCSCCYRGLNWKSQCAFRFLPLRQFFACQDIYRAPH